MSTTIDERVVEMKFDNKNFEKNVSTTMSTLDRLKAALDFKHAEKALDDLGDAANRFSLDGMNRALDSVSGKFNVMGSVAFSVINRIVNDAITAGQKIEQALGTGLTGLKAGFDKYSNKNTAVGTLISQGYDIAVVNDQLSKLNWFTDETSYNFVDMVSNIGKFTAAGKGLDESVQAMMGIANWAAMSGQNAATASRAMYQLSQAMGRGVMRLEDWKSIQTANMDTTQFREKAIEAAVALGTLERQADGTYKTLTNGAKKAFTAQELFASEGLTQGAWFTSDVMMKAFGEYSSAVDELYSYAESRGITASQAIEELGDSLKNQFGLKAFKAAQEARNWGDVTSSVADAVSTSWMNVFETIFGDYEEAKTVFTQMANDLYDIFAEPVNEINDLLFDGLASGWKRLSKTSGVSLQQMKKQFTVYAKQYGVDLDALIEEHGTFEAALKSGWVDADILTSSFRDLEDQLTGLSEADLIAAGYTEKFLEELKALNKEFRDNPESVSEWVASLSGTSGRENLMQAIWNLRDALFLVEEIDEETTRGRGIVAVFKDAWAEVFPAPDGERIRSIAERIRDFTASLIPSEQTAEKFKAAFKGVISVLDILKQAAGPVVSLVWDGFKSAAKTIGNVLSKVGSFITGIAESNVVGQFFSKVVESIRKGLKGIGPLLSGLFTKIRTVAGKVLDLLKLAWNSLSPEVRTALENAGKYISDKIRKLAPIFKPVKKAAQNAFGSFAESIRAKWPDIQAAVAKLGPLAKNAFGKVRAFADKAWPVVQRVAARISVNLMTLFQSLERLGRALWPYIQRAISEIGPFLSNIWSKISSGSKKAWPVIQKVFGSISEVAVKAFGLIDDAFRKVTGLGVLDTFLNLGIAIANTIDHLSEFLEKLQGEDFKVPKWLSDLSATFTSFLTDIPKNIQQAINLVKNPPELFKAIGETLTNIWNTVSKSGIWKKIFGKDSFLATLAGKLGEWAGLGLGKLTDALAAADPGAIGEWISGIGKALFAVEGLRTLHNIGSANKSISRFFNQVRKLAKNASWTLDAVQTNLRSKAWLATAAAIGVTAWAVGQIVDTILKLTESIKNISDDDEEAFIKAGITVGGIMLALGFMIRQTSVKGQGSVGNVSLGQAASYAAVAYAVESIVMTTIRLMEVIHTLSAVDEWAIWKAAGIIVAVMAVMGLMIHPVAPKNVSLTNAAKGGAKGNAKASGSASGTPVSLGQAASYVALAYAVKILADAIVALSAYSLSDLWSGIAVVGGLLVGIGTFVAIMAHGSIKTGAAWGMVAVIAVMGLLITELAALALGIVFLTKDMTPEQIQNAKTILTSLTWLIGVVLGLTAALAALSGLSSGGKIAATALVLAVVAALIGVLGYVMYEIMSLGDVSGMMTIMWALIGLLAVTTLVTFAFMKMAEFNIKALLIGVTALAVVALAVSALAIAIGVVLSVGNVSGAVTIMGVLIGLLVVMTLVAAAFGFMAMVDMASLLVGIVAIAILSVAVGAVAEAIGILVGLGDIDSAVRAGRALEEFLGVMMGVAGVLALIGSAGGGLGALAMMAGGIALVEIAGAIALVAHALIDADAGIRGISRSATPENLAKVKEAAIAIADFGAQLGKMHSDAAGGIKDLGNIAGPLERIFTAMSLFEGAVSDSFFENLATGMANFGESVTAHSPAIVDAFHGLIIDCTQAIDASEWFIMGSQAVYGFVNGFNSRVEWAAAQVAAGMATIAAAGEAALSINSPSKLFASYGGYSVLGYVKGFEDEVPAAERALQDTMLKIADYMDGNRDFDPVIRPVLDLSNVQAGAARIGGYFSATQAVGIAARMNSANAVNAVNDDDASTATGATYSFVQNNYSPKPLNRLEIYRQTRNQISAIEGAMRAV